MNGFINSFDPEDAEPKPRRYVEPDRDLREDEELSPSHRLLKESLEATYKTHRERADLLRHGLKEALAAQPSVLSLVEHYATAVAREALARDAVERMGFAK